ncbi:uncharacterized protein BDZ99DRAFT_458559 [Mytilinidion resinicola]|uniref:Uncharacterized protein n=1 Tax=Mytilinidion resinicola TaxID=574789 RepID=A0A6A6Z028_9PEZI|nr:uncharacterized protein BDZ99DRAFT_458559 [Mytilinidion resinicola]KAF2814536.1 hypothetical protein BDZ99DRAFT_458559 [Mytilinidion resinicola]
MSMSRPPVWFPLDLSHTTLLGRHGLDFGWSRRVLLTLPYGIPIRSTYSLERAKGRSVASLLRLAAMKTKVRKASRSS